MNFILFYYFVLTGNEKASTCLDKPNKFFGLIVTPFIWMLIQLIIGLIISSWLIVYLLFLYILIISLNIVIVCNTEKKCRNMRRKKIKERATYDDSYREYLYQKAKMQHKHKSFDKGYFSKSEYKKHNDKEEKQSNNDGPMEKALRTLDISGPYNKELIRGQYRKLSKKYHPDMPSGDNQRFIEIKNAYDLIKQIN